MSGWACGGQFGALQRVKRQQSLQIRQLYHRETKLASLVGVAAFLAVWWSLESLAPINHYCTILPTLTFLLLVALFLDL